MIRNTILKLATSIIFLTSIKNAYSAGWAVDSYSASSLANSNAGAVINSNDNNNATINPSLIGNVESSQFSASTTYLDINIEAKNKENNAGVNAPIPSFSFAKSINDKVNIGIAVTVPFGLATKYNENWDGKEHAIESEIKSLNINPIASYKLIDNKLTVGLGFQAQQFETYLTKYNSTLGILVEAKGDDWGYGLNAGLTYKINPNIIFGFGYRSNIEHKTKGTVKAGALSSDYIAKLTTPETISAGLSYKLCSKTEIIYDTNLTRWSRIEDIAVIAEQNFPTDTLTLNWKDSWKNALGLNYKINKKFILKTGVAYETSAVDKNREPRIPTSDKVWTSAGFNYDINSNSDISFAYVHQFFKDSKVNLTSPTVLDADYETNVNIVSIGYRLNF